MKIEIPFSEEMARMALTNRKFCTSRNKKYGSVGDTFRLEDDQSFGDFEIVAIVRRPLWFVACCWHLAEGFERQGGFIKIWHTLHPKLGWEPDKEVWVHWFVRAHPGG